jgi:hypothetical protein
MERYTKNLVRFSKGNYYNLVDERGSEVNLQKPSTLGQILSVEGWTRFWPSDTFITRDELSNLHSVDNFVNLERPMYPKKNKEFLVTYPYYRVCEGCYIDVDGVSESYDLKTRTYDLFSVNAICYNPDMDEKDANNMDKLLNKILIFENTFLKKTRIGIIAKNAKGYEVLHHSIEPKPVDVDKHYNDDFKDVDERIREAIEDKKSGIFIFHGEPGTGKTNYIKHLTGKTKRKFIYVPSNMIDFLSDPSFISTMIDNKNAIIVIEDCEEYIKQRGQGAGNNFVSTLLNVSDGILSDIMDIQVIATFNSGLQDIDKALLREGRLLVEYRFGKLSEDKVKKIAKEDSIELEELKPMTISEIYNMGSKVGGKKKETKIGFK